MMTSPSPPLNHPLRVAVVGAGAAGLVSAREIQLQGHSVVVYEQSHRLGGVWLYTPQVETDPLSLQPDRKPVHSSMYQSLRTNLPREIMGFLDFPFLPKEGRDERRYPGHEEVLLYLQDFAEHFQLLPCIRFGRKVNYVGLEKFVVQDGLRTLSHGNVPKSIHRNLELIRGEASCSDKTTISDSHAVEGNHFSEIQWRVSSELEGEKPGINSVEEEVFDAVVVCTGHYFQPKVAVIPGIDKWPGMQLHSHNYRAPHPFTNKVVVVIGNSSSGVDIAREIATVARVVHWAGRKWDTSIDTKKHVGPSNNIRLHLMVESAHEDGTLKFQDGASVVADVILYCTGYAFSFPFLDTNDIVKVNDNCVGPLYQHVFPPLLAPSLSFIGLPFKVIPFPLMELQAKWISLNLSGKIQMPSRKEMMEAIKEFYASLTARGLGEEHTHNLGSYQFEYDNWLADQCGCKPLEHWRKEIYFMSSKSKATDPDNYRDRWSDQDLNEIAMKDLLKLGETL